MQPIVNGLQADYNEQVDFLYLNAQDDTQGEAAYQTYSLRGHPALVWVMRDGQIGWTKVGVISAEELDQAIRDSLEP